MATKQPTTAHVEVLPHAELCPQGTLIISSSGTTLADALLGAGIAIEHACDKVGACATCHVHVRRGAEFVNEADDEELDELDNAWGLDAQSRLACCTKLRGGVVVVELPKYSRNHARE